MYQSLRRMLGPYANLLASSDPEIIPYLSATYYEHSYLSNNLPIKVAEYSYRIGSYNIFFNIKLSTMGVLDGMRHLNVSPDILPACILIKFLAKPILQIYNISLNIAVFPNIWKFSILLPQPKNVSKGYIENRRDIAQLS